MLMILNQITMLLRGMHMVWQILCFRLLILNQKIKNKHLNNLFYTGQLTVPGPGVPPSIISGDVVANYIIENHKK